MTELTAYIVADLKRLIGNCCGEECKGNKHQCPLVFSHAQEVAEQTGDPALLSPAHKQCLEERKVEAARQAEIARKDAEKKRAKSGGAS